MTKRMCLWMILVGTLLIVQHDTYAADNSYQAQNLHCEYLVNPEGVDVVSPRLNWIVTSPQRGQKQTAYRILVASDPTLLQNNDGDLWDSGKVESDQTLHIAYQGKPLSSYQRCWWKVRSWDKDNRPSEWSQTAYWSMGILSQDQWKAQWLGYAVDYTPAQQNLKGQWRQQSPSPLFRKEFKLKNNIKQAHLYICGLGYHEAYINAQKVGDHVLDPAFTRYDRACLYVTHDITKMLSPGDNAIGVMLGNGWYNVFTRAAWDFDKAPWRDKPKMLAQLRIEYTDGTIQTIVSDDTWKASTGPVILDGIRQGEYYDARLEMEGWTKPKYDDTKWTSPQRVSAPKGILRAQMAPPVKVIQSITPVKRTEPKPGIYIFDLGQNIAGWVKLNVSGPAGTKIQLRYAERIHQDGTLDQDEIKRHVRDAVFQTDTYILKGRGHETWQPRFVYHGFRYVEVTGFPTPPESDTITGCVVNTAFDQAGRFTCSSDMLNRIQDCTLWAYRGNFVGYPTDCPHREKNGWTGDAHLAVEQAMYNWSNGGGYTKWLLDLKDEQRDSGELPGIVPTGGWGYAWGNGPAWDSAYLIIPWEMYRYYGDTRILETHFDRFKRYVDYLTGKSENLIVSIGLNDWAPAKTTTPGDITSTAFYYMDTLITARSAKILNRTEDADKYFKLADQIKTAFNERFYKGDGIYSVGSQTALSFSLYAGLVPESEKSKVLAKLLENIQSCDNHIDTGILGAKAIFNILSENGFNETAYKMITNPTAPSYADWINQGATTLWEMWNGRESRNHIMYGDVGAWFYKNLAGINLNPDITGNEAFKHFILHPRLLPELTHVDASYESIRGNIKSAWKMKDNAFTWTVRIPANTTATIYVPADTASTVQESGRPVKKSEGTTFIKYEKGYALYHLQSGTYQFTSELADN